MKINMSVWNWKHKSAVLTEKTGVDVSLNVSLNQAPAIHNLSCSLKDLFENVSNHNVINFIEQIHFTGNIIAV